MMLTLFLVGLLEIHFSIATHALTDNSRLQINEHSPGNMLPRTGLREEGVEGVVSASDGLVAGHLAIRLNTVLKAVQLPAGIA